MDWPWADRSFVDWLWVQVRTGFRRQHVYPIPDVDQPGCEAGVVSTRHWLDWRQANSVTVFGIEFMRGVAAVLAERGITPVDEWVEQSWHTRAGSPTRHQSFMDPYGEANVAALVNKIAYPVDSVTFHQIIMDVVPQVLESFPMELSKTVGKPGQHMIAPYLWTIDLKTPRIPSTFKTRNHLREIVFTSPHYYCGYTVAQGHIPVYRTSAQWPLDAKFDLVPLTYDQNPKTPVRRSDIPQVANEALSTVSRISERLGFTVGPASAGRWVKDGGNANRYVVSAHVENDLPIDELVRRARPFGHLATVVAGQPGIPQRNGRHDIVRFAARPGFAGAVSESPDDGRLVLTVEST